MELILTDSASSAADFARSLDAARRVGYFASRDTVITHYEGRSFHLAAPERYSARYAHWRMEDLPIIPERYFWEPEERAVKQLTLLKDLFAHNDFVRVIIAGEPSGEGEYEARLALSYAAGAGRARIVRLWTSAALTREAIGEALCAPEPDSAYDHLATVAEMRDRADWLVGHNVSRLLSLTTEETASCGRLTSPLLAYLVSRKEQSAQRDLPFGERVAVTVGKGEAGGELTAYAPAKTALEARNILASLSGATEGVVRAVERSPVKGLKRLLNLTELQKRANVAYGLSAGQTLAIAFRLHRVYRCLSYPCTTERLVKESEHPLLAHAIQEMSRLEPILFQSISPAAIAGVTVADGDRGGGHAPLLVLAALADRASGEERAVYRLVVESMAEALSLAPERETVTVSFEIGGVRFEARHTEGAGGSAGLWDDVGVHATPEPGDAACEEDIETLTEGEILTVRDVRLIADRTHEGDRATEAELLAVMEERGIGSAAVRSSLIERLVRRGSCVREGATIRATGEGVKLIAALRALPAIASFVDLEEAGKGEALCEVDPARFFAATVERLREAFAALPRQARSSGEAFLSYACPLCGARLRESGERYTCANAGKGCRYTLSKIIAGHRLTEGDLEALTTPGRAYGPPASFRTAGGGSGQGRLYYDYRLQRMAIDYIGPRYSRIPRSKPKGR